jgi:hypothetical protein
MLSPNCVAALPADGSDADWRFHAATTIRRGYRLLTYTSDTMLAGAAAAGYPEAFEPGCLDRPLWF